ncbi:MAG: ATP-binding protein [Gammaproteobacteria bacterium]
MKGSFTPQINPKIAVRRLRRMLALFFVGLSLPVYLLLHKVYSQLETEAYFNQRNQAMILAEGVERHLQQLMEPEQNRPIAEYRFFNVMESPLLQSAGVRFSPLSSLPPKSDVPGLIGYFQIDPDGSFKIPALPEVSGDLAGLSREELSRRLALKDELRRLLGKDDRGQEMASVLDEKDAVSSPDRGDLEERDSLRQKENRLDDVFRFSDGDRSETAGGKPEEKKENEQIPHPAIAKKSKILSDESLERLNIDAKRFEQKFARNGQEKRRQDLFQSSYRSRREMVRLPEQTAASEYFNRPAEQAAPPLAESAEFGGSATSISNAGESENAVRSGRLSPIRIFSVESEVSPIQMQALDKGHFCFFRRVWHDNSRYTQGFIVNRRAFLDAVMRSFVEQGRSLPLSSFLIGYDGDLLGRFRLVEADSETLLYRSALSPPFQNMEIIVNSASVAAGPESVVVDMLAVSLGVILVAGLYGFYRLGSGQIDLARKQRNFISAVSHELKTPLTSIRMYGEMLRSDWIDDENKKKTYYDYIFFESERLSRLINNVLQLARLSNHAYRMELHPVAVPALLKRVGDKIRTQTDAAGFQLKFSDIGETADDMMLEVDEDAFLQIMINLVDNAIKFASKAANKTIDFGCRVHGGGREVVFFVRDYGQGIEKNQMKKIFRLFYRAGDELTRTQPGTGIGLALVTQLAEKMNAKVDVINRAPGAEFQVVFQRDAK